MSFSFVSFGAVFPVVLVVGRPLTLPIETDRPTNRYKWWSAKTEQRKEVKNSVLKNWSKKGGRLMMRKSEREERRR